MSASIFQQRVRLKYRGAVKAVGDEIPTHFRLILLRVPQGGINSARAGEDWLVILAVTSRQPSRAAGRPGASLQLLAFAYSPRRAGSLTIALPRRRKLRGFRCAPGCMPEQVRSTDQGPVAWLSVRSSLRCGTHLIRAASLRATRALTKCDRLNLSSV